MAGNNYPIGQQDFKTLREDKALYIDKTAFVEKIAGSKSRYLFLARPRRFGKSLFLSTLRYFFEGQRELFKDLYIDSIEWDWQPYPVIHIDLNPNSYEEPDLLDGVLGNQFKRWEGKYDVKDIAGDLSSRLGNIIKAAHEKTGRQVVVLVDEYDKPLVKNLNNDANFDHYRSKLFSIYSNFKSSAEHLRLVFLTGVSRFSKLSVFSALNNLDDISFDDEYADICGITENELLENFQTGINALAEKCEITYREALQLLKDNYDGYRFAPGGSDIYNPWSLLSCMAKRNISDHWSRTGTPSIVAESLKNVDADLEKVLNTRCPFRKLEGLDLRSIDPIALLYQSGYLTIKKYDSRTDTVTLGVPNLEVRESLFEALLPYYITVKRGLPDTVVFDMIEDIREGRPESFVRNLDFFLSGVPYEMKMDNENNFHNAIYILLTLIGVRTETEVHTSDGRIDLLVKTEEYIYIIELKFDNSAEKAMAQIKEKQYCMPYYRDPRRLFLIGLNFSSGIRHLDPPMIEEVKK